MTSPVKIWRNQKKIVPLLGRQGKIISWTVVRVPPVGFEDQAPYPVALVKLDDGEIIMSQLVDYEEKDLRFGKNVLTVIRRTVLPEKDAVIPYGIKVKPLGLHRG
jgi:uncharacterized OB-fold protein